MVSLRASCLEISGHDYRSDVRWLGPTSSPAAAPFAFAIVIELDQGRSGACGDGRSRNRGDLRCGWSDKTHHRLCCGSALTLMSNY